MTGNQKIYPTVPSITGTLTIDLNQNAFIIAKNKEVARFLKGIFHNRESFEKGFLNKIRNIKEFNTKIFVTIFLICLIMQRHILLERDLKSKAMNIVQWFLDRLTFMKCFLILEQRELP